VLTDVGLISAGGDTPQALGSALAASAVPDPDDQGVVAARIADFDPKRYMDRKGLKHLSRTSQLACAAASRLVSGLDGVKPERVGVVLGTAWATLDTIVRFEREAHVEGPRFVDPILFTETVANVPGGQISIFNGWSAFNATVASGSASGLEAIGRAIDFLAERRGDVAVAGGADALNEHLVRALHAEGLLGSGSGTAVAGEGACLFVVEAAEHARRRGARPLGRVRAWAQGFVGDADDGSVASRASLVVRLLDEAGVDPAAVAPLVLSASGDTRRDRVEAAVVRAVFGGRSDALRPKRVLGETWAASGPLGMVAALEAARENPSAAVRQSVILECSPTGHMAGLVLEAEERADGC
jgi:3-oxoacyl-[acyl-carrier-protein] synthase II